MQIVTLNIRGMRNDLEWSKVQIHQYVADLHLSLHTKSAIAQSISVSEICYYYFYKYYSNSLSESVLR